MLLCALALASLARLALASPLAAAAANFSLVGDAAFRCLNPGDTCRPSIRLAPALLNTAGAAWCLAPIDVTQTLEVRFSFQLGGGSASCAELEGVDEYCGQRGGHGFAVVFQNAPTTPLAQLGAGAEGLGYAGIPNAVAIEFDTWFDDALSDHFDNHVAVQARALAGTSASADHQFELGAVTDVPDLADGATHRVRLAYEPSLSGALLHPELCAATRTCGKLDSAEHAARLVHSGVVTAEMGALLIFVDDLVEPRALVPLSLAQLTSSNTPYIGFTAASGARQWQDHDVFDITVCVAGACQPRFVFA